METKIIPLSKLAPNKGQIEGLPKNPRLIKNNKFRALVKSLRDDPEMMQLRELIAYDPGDGTPYVIIGGNMRYHALKDIGEKTAPVKLLPPETPVEKLQAYTIKDNNNYGEWDFDMLANEWDISDLMDWGVDVPEISVPNDLDEEEKGKVFVVKITFEDEERGKQFRTKYENLIKLDFPDATISIV